MRRALVLALPIALLACSADDGGGTMTDGATTSVDSTTSTSSSTSSTSSGGSTSTSSTGDAPTSDAPTTPTSSTGATTGSTGETEGASSSTTGDLGPMVDVNDPQLYSFEFTPDQADAEATEVLATQLAYLDTTAPLQGKLVVYLHGAGVPTVCGSKEHGQVLAKMGFHVFSPCYRSDYGVGNCGDDIGGCRLEAFEGVDHHPFIDITPPNSIETRVVKGLSYLQAQHPGGDWQYFLDGDAPRWDRIIISGISHGASSSGVIAMNRIVDRAVMLSGPLDTNQAWLKGQPMTAIERFWGFTHTADDQHPGHLQAFADLGMVGDPAVVDDAQPPYGGSQRLVTSAPTNNGHGSTQAGGASPKDANNDYLFMPAWETMYGVTP
ncbi:MAG: hypothetical protein H6710_23475 [Myxococcales bacterium]|nr:hypothetical protein [Myxococcales bacterium]